jgi:hypothetical protein
MNKKMLPVLMSAVFTGYTLYSHAQANQQLSNLTSPTAINQSLLPNVDNSKDLGNSTLQWKNIYLHDGLYLNGGNLAIHSPGINNFFAGRGAGKPSVTGQGNTGLGTAALASISSGSFNTASGINSLFANTSGQSNTANGGFALSKNTTGNYNTASGYSALSNNTSGAENTANGVNALFSNTLGKTNTAVGVNALFANTTGSWDIGIGNGSLQNNTTGNDNTAIGFNAMNANINGVSNVAVGKYALSGNKSGNSNTAFGIFTLSNNTSGGFNTALGTLALSSDSTGSNNTAIGSSADVTRGNLTNATAIGYNAKVNASNKVRIGNTSVTSIGGQVGWTIFSDGRYKRDIKENVPGLTFINSLRPITYTVDIRGLNEYYNKGGMQAEEKIDEKAKAEMDKAAEDAGKIVHTGFVAQEVEAAAKKLNYEFNGVDKPQDKDGLYGLRYEEFIMPLVKAVQELSKKNDEKDAKIEDLQKQIDELKGTRTTSVPGTAQQSATNLTLTSASLDQNNPNPFAGATTIRYNLPAGFRTAQMVIRDNSGKAIKQVQLNTAGNGTVNMDASTLTSGTYSYSLVVDGKTIVNKKMTVAH